MGEGFLATLEQAGEAFLWELKAFAHGFDVGTRHESEVAGFDLFDLFAGFRGQDLLAEATVGFDFDGFDETSRTILGGGKVDLEGGGVGFGIQISLPI